TMARNESIRDIDINSGNLNNLHFAVEVSTIAIVIPIIIIFKTKINNAKTYSAAPALCVTMPHGKNMFASSEKT
ncbi:MAG: hypothetical protein QSU88_11900, partial [Candidatus Methanoperedens sp.]|nr:hypothetical protein [Candidatus Methanoperedens sp.]